MRSTTGAATLDPLALLGDLTKRYDLALRLDLAQVPPARRARFVAGLYQILRDAPRRSTESESDYAVRTQSMLFTLQAVAAAVEHLDRVTVGLRLDHASRRLTAEAVLEPRPGTPPALQWSEYQKKTSSWAGFRPPGATAAASWSDMVPQSTAEAMTLVSGALATKESGAAVEVLDAARAVFADRRFEGAAGVVLESDRATWVSALRLPDDGQVQRNVEQLAAMAGRNSELTPGRATDTDRSGAVRLYTFSRPIAPDAKRREALVRLFGERVDVVLGVGRENLYVAIGRDALETLRRTLAAARTAQESPQPPLECSVALGPVAELAAELARDEDKMYIGIIARALKESGGKDHVRLTAGPVDGALRIRVEMEEGVLRIAGLVAGMMAQGRTTAEAAANE